MTVLAIFVCAVGVGLEIRWASERIAIAIAAATGGETAQHGSTEGKSAGPKDIAQGEVA